MEIEHCLIELNLIEKWCSENGFDVYRHGSHVGIICEYGDRKLLFLKGDDESPRPAFFRGLLVRGVKVSLINSFCFPILAIR
jgi:hypothetical protein